MMKKHTIIKIIQEVSPAVMSGHSDIRFIILQQVVGSTEVKKWEKETHISESELVTSILPVFQRLKEEDAVEVFRHFYRDTFTKI
jgi:ABC-type histidine transport system ATPase subunit